MSSRFVLYSIKAGFDAIHGGVFNMEADLGVRHIGGATSKLSFSHQPTTTYSRF